MNLKLINLISGFIEQVEALDGKSCPFCGGGRNYDWIDYHHNSGCPRWSIMTDCKDAIKFLANAGSPEHED